MSAPDPMPADLPTPRPTSMLAHRIAPGRHGAKSGEAGVAISERAVEMVLVSAFAGCAAMLGAALLSRLNLMLPGPSRSTTAGDITALWVQPATWLITAPRSEVAPVQLASPLSMRLHHAAGDTAAVVDQSYGKACLRIAGPAARKVLAKGCRVDLHPRAFAKGQVAGTAIAHVNLTLVLVDDTPTFDLFAPLTFAENTLEWLEVSAAEFGYTLG